MERVFQIRLDIFDEFGDNKDKLLDEVRVEMDKLTENLFNIRYERSRRKQEYLFIDEDDDGGSGTETVTIRPRDRIDDADQELSSTKWIDEDINYTGTERGVLRTLGLRIALDLL